MASWSSNTLLSVSLISFKDGLSQNAFFPMLWFVIANLISMGNFFGQLYLAFYLMVSRLRGFWGSILQVWYFWGTKLTSSYFCAPLSKLIALFLRFSNKAFFFSSSSLNFVAAWPSSLIYLSLKVLFGCKKLPVEHFALNLSDSLLMLSSPSECRGFLVRSEFKLWISIVLRLRRLVHLRDSRAFYFLRIRD